MLWYAILSSVLQLLLVLPNLDLIPNRRSPFDASTNSYILQVTYYRGGFERRVVYWRASRSPQTSFSLVEKSASSATSVHC